MKKLVTLIAAFFSLIICLTSTTQVKADVDYDINNVEVNAKVNPNGSLSISRKIEYSFDSSAHGIYYRQNLDANQALIDPVVTIQTNNANQEIVKPGKGANNTYQLTKDDQGYRFKVFHNIKEDSRVTVSYRYTITNAIINWKDTAELNFKIIGNGWDTDLDKVLVRVTINNGKQVPDLRAWAHGASSGYIEVNRDKGQLVLEDNDVSGDEGIELHTIFPKSITNLNKNTKNKVHKQAIISQEKKLAALANRKRARQRIVHIIISLAAVIAGGMISIFLIFKILKTKNIAPKPQKMSALSRSYEIPGVSPVAAQILDTGQEPNSEAFTAYITALAGKKHLKIEKLSGKDENYQISLIDETLKNEKSLLAYLFDYVGDGHSFTTKRMRDIKSDNLANKYQEWRSEQFNKVIAAGYINEALWQRISNLKSALMLSSIGMFVISWCLLTLLKAKIPTYILWGLVALDAIAYLYFNYRASFYTNSGSELTNQVRSFKKMIKDIGNFKMRDVGELIFWEDIMPYAVAFGLSDKVIDELHTEFSEQELSNGFVSGIWVSHHLDLGFADSFSSSLEHGASVKSSGSGSSGGFSGGSSGGFGGGSGGGAF
ncbi:putative membrane protein [Lactobacillus colini]|uniref:Membrane protein n=1 Tax=Lactobacillus colini TaxID=1819254 RepID=A0ABS4MG38_9LACO|nr:DUF2207 domain-containing protein [Lactobacillus colini]MBP2058291.1 putative membrane protein [Lactobacillus colini]